MTNTNLYPFIARCSLYFALQVLARNRIDFISYVYILCFENHSRHLVSNDIHESLDNFIQALWLLITMIKYRFHNYD